MNSLSQSRLASSLVVLAGVWLLVSPLFISMTGATLINVLTVGAIFALAGLVQLLWINVVPGWIEAIVAIWLFIASFAFTASVAAAWNAAITAVVVFLLSVWDSLEVTNAQHEHHARI